MQLFDLLERPGNDSCADCQCMLELYFLLDACYAIRTLIYIVYYCVHYIHIDASFYYSPFAKMGVIKSWGIPLCQLRWNS